MNVCQICGCSEHDACYDELEQRACAWFVPFLCDFCVLGWLWVSPGLRQPLYEPPFEISEG